MARELQVGSVPAWQTIPSSERRGVLEDRLQRAARDAAVEGCGDRAADGRHSRLAEYAAVTCQTPKSLGLLPSTATQEIVPYLSLLISPSQISYSRSHETSGVRGLQP